MKSGFFASQEVRDTLLESVGQRCRLSSAVAGTACDLAALRLIHRVNVHVTSNSLFAGPLAD